MKKLFKRFLDWYEKHRQVHTVITALLFVTQLVHLYWLGAHVIAFRITGQSYFNPTSLWQTIITLVDYIEIPALISATFLYVTKLRKGFSWKPILFLLLLNSQWLHLFWITDEFVVSELTGTVQRTILPAWLAWVAILIDYLELPVIYDTIKQSLKIIKTKFFASAG